MPFLKCHKESRLKGLIERSKRNGWRCAIYDNGLPPDKSRYIGNWENDAKQGFGIQYWRGKLIYQGEWRAGKRHGIGVLVRVDRQSGAKRVLYAGCWREGKRHGFGVRYYPDGSSYQGYFRDNLRHGYGRMQWADRRYEGVWKNDLQHGVGLLLDASGNRYKGQFVRGRKHGRGSYHHLASGQLQCGEWANDSCISSVVRDASFRQHARAPTPYPIPPILEERLHEDSTVSSEPLLCSPKCPGRARDLCGNRL
ncbi:hypothetical protein TKK_0000407 [Trichogramma kaykai]